MTPRVTVNFITFHFLSWDAGIGGAVKTLAHVHKMDLLHNSCKFDRCQVLHNQSINHCKDNMCPNVPGNLGMNKDDERIPSIQDTWLFPPLA